MKTKMLYLTVTVLLILISCTKENVKFEKSDNQKFFSECSDLTIESFNAYGIYHNNAMNNFNVNFEPETGDDGTPIIIDLGEAIDFIRDFNVTFLINELISEGSEEFITSEYNRGKWLVVTELTYDSLVQINNSNNILSIINNLYSYNLIDDFENNLLQRIFNCCNLNYDQALSNEDFADSISNFEQLWNEQNYTTCSSTGYVSAYVISIAKASVEWWEENFDPIEYAVPVWVGADVVGAALGAGTGAVSSYVGTGSVNWKSVGISATAGAVAGSTGIIGKAAKWISKL